MHLAAATRFVTNFSRATHTPAEVKGGSCVWSECSMGYINTGDDDQYGDGRDGDENWYQFRTQSFCANAAYSLYGRKKSDFHPLGFIGCTRRHFINSFFTYGGADNLLKSIGKQPTLYYDESDYYQKNNNGGNNGDDGYSYVEPSNSECVPFYGTLDDDGYANDRQLNSGDNNQNNAAYSSTLGCTSEGKYDVGVFKGGSCDGNYFLKTIDKFRGYNRQYWGVGCHSLWNRDANEVTYERMEELLSNSWACDITLYPDSCPDPYGVKGHYEYALRTAAQGGDPMRAYRASVWRRPIRAFSWVLAFATAVVLLVTYNVKNHARIMARGGGWKVGLQCLKEDTKESAQVHYAHARGMASKWREERRRAAEKRRELREQEKAAARKSRRRSLKKSKSRSRSRRKEREEDFNDEDSGVELRRVSPRKSSKSRSKSRGDVEVMDEGVDDRRSRRKSKSKRSKEDGKSPRSSSGRDGRTPRSSRSGMSGDLV